MMATEAKTTAMVITRTPFRMSFFGGGSDIPEHFENNAGAVLSTTFDKYCFVNVRYLPPFFSYKSEIVYSEIERVASACQITHPLVREAMLMSGLEGIRLTYEGDLPARTGLGTSSSFAVGTLNAFHILKGEETSKRRLAEEAIVLERERCKEAGGWQDQIAAAYGGLNYIEFDNDDFSVSPVEIDSDRNRALNDRLMLFFTGFTRLSSEVQRVNRVESKTKSLNEMAALALEGKRILENDGRSLSDFGSLLDYTWRIKRGLGSMVSTAPIDSLYERAIRAGATGGKLLGAGGGGFLLLYVEPELQSSVSAALEELTLVPFRFEESGTQVIHFSHFSDSPLE